MPFGSFTLDRTSEAPILFLAGGVGITPLLSMVKALRAEQSQRNVTFVSAVRHGAFHVLAGEVQEEIEGLSGATQTVFYETPTEADRAAAIFDHEGRISFTWLQEHITNDTQIYVCGPRLFMQSVIHMLLELGMTHEQIHYEVFGPALAFSID
jgi:nitric oxide dioxygenase